MLKNVPMQLHFVLYYKFNIFINTFKRNYLKKIFLFHLFIIVSHKHDIETLIANVVIGSITIPV